MKKAVKFTVAVLAIAFTFSRIIQGDYAAAAMSAGLLMTL